MIPVLVVDVTDEEADKILATMDPPTGMAGADPDKLADLLGDLEVTSDAMRAMLDDLAQETSSCPTLRRVTCPECGHQFDPK